MVPVTFTLTVALLGTSFPVDRLACIDPSRPSSAVRLAATGYRAKVLLVKTARLTPLPLCEVTNAVVIPPVVLTWPGPRLLVSTDAETLSISTTLTFLAAPLLYDEQARG